MSSSSSACYQICPPGYSLKQVTSALEPHLCVPDDPTRGMLPISAPQTQLKDLKTLLKDKQQVGTCGIPGCTSYGCIMDPGDSQTPPSVVVGCGNQAPCQICPTACPSGYALNDAKVLCVPSDNNKTPVSAPGVAPTSLPVDQSSGEQLGTCSNCSQLGCVIGNDGGDVIGCDGNGKCLIPQPEDGQPSCEDQGKFWGQPARLWAILAVVLAGIALLMLVLGIIRYFRRPSGERSPSHFLSDLFDGLAAFRDAYWMTEVVFEGLFSFGGWVFSSMLNG